MTTNTHPRLTELHTTYTRTTGPASKLMATAAGTTRVVTTLRGLDDPGADALVAAFNALAPNLAHFSATSTFTDQVHALGVRTHQVSDPHAGTATLNLSWLADLPVDDRVRGCVDHRPDTFAVCPIARILLVCDTAPDPVTRALRAELAGLLGSYEGRVVTVAWPTFLDALNVGPWIDTIAASTIENLLVGDFPDHIQASEQVVWDLSAGDGPLDRPTPDEVDSFGVAFCLDAVVDRLHERRPDVLDAMLASLRADGFLTDTDDLADSWGLDDDQAQALRRALALRTTAS